MDRGGVIKKFYIKRFASIYPLYLAVLLYIIGTRLAFFDVWARNVLMIPVQITGMQTFFSEITGNMGNSGIWFVSVMLVLYILFPAACYLVNNVSQKCTIYVIIFLYLIATYVTVFQAYFNSYVYANPAFRFLEFLMGMFLAKVFLEKYDKKQRGTGIKILLTIIFYYVGVNFLYRKVFFNNIPFNYSPTYFNFLSIPVFGILIYQIAKWDNKKVCAIAKSSIIKYLNNLSYSFYIVQTITFVEVAKFLNIYMELKEVSSGILFIVTFIFNFVLCVVFYEIIEKPLKKFLRNKLLN